MKSVAKGFVYLVGAGPGRADLITVRGAEILKKADCIIYDKLANPALLKFARKEAEVIGVPKRIGTYSVSQDQIFWKKPPAEKPSSGSKAATQASSADVPRKSLYLPKRGSILK